MSKKFIEDELFKKIFNQYFPLSITEESLKRIESIITGYSSDLVWGILNVIKASVVSESNFTECYDRIHTYMSGELHNTGNLDKLILSVALKYLITSDDREIKKLMATKRDFLAEVIAFKDNISQVEVTDEMKQDMLNDPGDVYSITDPPLESWDEYFFNVCRQAARNSKCLSRRIGAVLVKDKSIISTGYNGPPRGVPRCDHRWELDQNFAKKYRHLVPEGTELEGVCPRYPLGAKSGGMLDICVAGHAEENTILNAARMGICTMDTTLYMTCGIPCFRCIVKIINAGIKEIVVTGIKMYDDNAEYLLNNSSVKVRLFDF